MGRVGFTREMVLGFREFRALAWLRVKGAASKNGTRPRVTVKMPRLAGAGLLE